jgi:hypothetical protein
LSWQKGKATVSSFSEVRGVIDTRTLKRRWYESSHLEYNHSRDVVERKLEWAATLPKLETTSIPSGGSAWSKINPRRSITQLAAHMGALGESGEKEVRGM